MIDHVSARRLAATSIDSELTPAESGELQAHLAGCPECRTVAEALRRDATSLEQLDLGPVPIAVRAHVAIAAEERLRGSHVGRWIGLIAIGALLVVALGGGALGAGSSGVPPTEQPGNAVQWQTDVVALKAADFAILAGGQVFTAQVPKLDVHSDPGDAHYRTLEITWMEHGVEQRLYMYFGGDDTSWWVDEIRTYNGKAQAEWLYAKGPFFRSPIGMPWSGDIDIEMRDVDGVGGTPARLHLRDAVLQTTASDLVNGGPGDTIVLAEDARPFDAGQPLHCSGILQMRPKDAERVLLGLGYRVTWRYYARKDFVELRKDPPDGTMIIDEGPFVGTEGQLLIAVDEIVDANTFPPVPDPGDCPKADPNGPVLVPVATTPATPAAAASGDAVLVPISTLFASGGALHCSGILQMTPRDAERALHDLGYKLTWNDQVTGEMTSEAPDGVIREEPVVMPSGELMMFVAPVGDTYAVPIPFPADCPKASSAP